MFMNTSRWLLVVRCVQYVNTSRWLLVVRCVQYVNTSRFLWLLVVRCAQVLDMPENAAIKRELSQLVGQLAQTSGRRGGGILGAVAGMMGGGGSGGDGGVSHADPADVLARCRALAMNVAVPQSLVQDLAAAMRAAGECASASALLPDSQRHVGDRLARGKGCFIELLCSYVSCAHPYKVWRVRGVV
jgi:hypothetical protein